MNGKVDMVQKMAIEAAVKDMMQGGHISICRIDKILKMTGGVPSRKDYDVLSLLHCVDFKDMDPMLLRGLPLILSRVLESEGMELEFPANSNNLMLVK